MVSTAVFIECDVPFFQISVLLSHLKWAGYVASECTCKICQKKADYFLSSELSVKSCGLYIKAIYIYYLISSLTVCAMCIGAVCRVKLWASAFGGEMKSISAKYSGSQLLQKVSSFIVWTRLVKLKVHPRTSILLKYDSNVHMTELEFSCGHTLAK